MDTNNEINNLLDKLGNLYFQKKDYKNSIKCFLKVVNKFPNEYGRTGVMLNNLGIAYKELKKMEFMSPSQQIIIQEVVVFSQCHLL